MKLADIKHQIKEGFRFKVYNPDVEPEIATVTELFYEGSDLEVICVIVGQGDQAFYAEMYLDDDYNNVELLE